MFYKSLWIFLLSSLIATQLSAEEIILVADPWPPFNFETGSDQEGYIVDIARAVFEPHGHTVIYKNVPWKRAISGCRSGRYSGAIGASKTDAEGFVFPDEELAQNVLAFYVRKESKWRFQGLSSLGTISIGVVDGYDYRKWLNDYIQMHANEEDRVQVIAGYDPLKQNLMKLLHKRIDVVVDNEASIRYKAREMDILDEIKQAGYGVEPAYIYIAFSPKLPVSSLLARQLNDGIIELRCNGKLKKILDRYGLNDWKPN